MSEKFVIPPELLNFTLSPNLNFGNLYQPGTFGGDSYWNSIFGSLGIDTSKPAPSVAEFVPAPPPPPSPPPAATGFPTNHDWTKGPVTVGDIVYTPDWYQPSGEGDTNPGGLTGITASLRGSTDPGVKYLRYDPSGAVIGEGTYTQGERGFFRNFFSDLGSVLTDTPILQMASIIPSPIQPFAAAANAIINKDPLAGIAALAGAGGFTDVANAARVASAIDKDNILGAVTPGLSLAGISDIGGFSAKDISNAARAADALRNGNPLALAGIASSYLPGPTMPGAGTSEDIQEGFFEPGGSGFMPTEYLDDAEVQRELTSLLGRYPAPPPPSDWFLGENIMSGVPEWDMAAVNAGLPIGNLEQDFSVAQAKEGPRIVDSAGNVGNFVNGEFVVDTGVTPNLSYAATSAPAPSPRAPAPAPASTPRPTAAPRPAAESAGEQLTKFDPVIAQVSPYDLNQMFSLGQQETSLQDLMDIIGASRRS